MACQSCAIVTTDNLIRLLQIFQQVAPLFTGHPATHVTHPTRAKDTLSAENKHRARTTLKNNGGECHKIHPKLVWSQGLKTGVEPSNH